LRKFIFVKSLQLVCAFSWIVINLNLLLPIGATKLWLLRGPHNYKSGPDRTRICTTSLNFTFSKYVSVRTASLLSSSVLQLVAVKWFHFVDYLSTFCYSHPCSLSAQLKFNIFKNYYKITYLKSRPDHPTC
jgi:hypothetical protein